MTARNGVSAWLAGVGTACLVGIVLLLVTEGRTEEGWWVSAVALSSGWVAAAIAARDRRWCRTAAPAGALNVTALLYTLAVGWTALTGALVAAACLLSAVHVGRQTQRV